MGLRLWWVCCACSAEFVAVSPLSFALAWTSVTSHAQPLPPPLVHVALPGIVTEINVQVLLQMHSVYPGIQALQEAANLGRGGQ